MFLPDEITEVAKLDGVHAKIVDFEPHHIDKISYRSADSTFVQANKEQLVSRLPKGMSFSGTYDDQVFAMFGLVPYWKGCYECWLIPATDLDIHKMKMHRTSLRFFEYTAKVLRAKRYQCYVFSANLRAVRWIEMMLFKKEGLMKNFGPNQEDFFLYARYF
jgi:hypothetical protein